MGAACSRKRDQPADVDGFHGGVSGRYCKSGSSKWLATTFTRPVLEIQREKRKCPSLLELCTYKIREDIDNYGSFSMLPRDLSQQIFNELVNSQRLTDVSLEAFRDCALQDLHLGDYPSVNDNWMDVISSQGSSLLSVDLSGSDITDPGLIYLKNCMNLQDLNLNYCDRISDRGLKNISGLTKLKSLTFRRNSAITAQGMIALSGLVNLLKLDLEKCPGIHGGLIHIKGMTKLESLSIKWCNCITDADMKPLSGLTNLKSLQVSCSKVTDFGITYLKGLQRLSVLNLEGCPVTAAFFDSLSVLASLSYLNLSRCNLSDDGCEKLSNLVNLKVLNLGLNDITDACLVHLKGLTNLESLNLDSCRIGDDGLVHLTGLQNLKCLELSDTDVGSNGLRHLSAREMFDHLIIDYVVALSSVPPERKHLCNRKRLKVDFLSFSYPLKYWRNEEHSNGVLECWKNVGGMERSSETLEEWSAGLHKLQSINLAFTVVTDGGLRELSGLASLKSLNLDARQITDAGLAVLTTIVRKPISKKHAFYVKLKISEVYILSVLWALASTLGCCLTGLTHLDLFGARITDSGTNYLQNLKNLRSLEICGGGLTDAGVKNIKDLSSLSLLNLSQNYNLTDKTLEMISGLTGLVSLNVSSSRVTSAGLRHLKPLKNLRSLSLESCKVTASDMRKLQSASLPNLVNFRPE
ncbi:hypothetical protein V6N13_016069 [Hibiscus sabdariffa]